MQDINVSLFLRFSIWRVLCTRDCWKSGFILITPAGWVWEFTTSRSPSPHFTKEKGVNPMSVHKKCSSLLSLVPLDPEDSRAIFDSPYIFWNSCRSYRLQCGLSRYQKKLDFPRAGKFSILLAVKHHGWPSYDSCYFEPRSSFLISLRSPGFLNAGKYPPLFSPVEVLP